MAEEILDEAVRLLRAGHLVAFPTETVYGLGANATDADAVARIFAAKGRPTDHPLIVHLPSATHVEAWASDIPEAARSLMNHFWPGPLTIILPLASGAPNAVTGGLGTVGLRVPDHPLALSLLRRFDGGIAAPSANRFGSISPTTAAHVALELGSSVDLILDGGACRVGVESTIVTFTRRGAHLLRPGGVPAEAIEALLGARLIREAPAGIRAPGTLASHYAPRARVEAVDPEHLMEAASSEKGRVVVLGPRPVPNLPHIELPRDPQRAAARLYSALREVDDGGFDVAVIALPPTAGLGEAVADRIRRAAAPRPPGDV